MKTTELTQSITHELTENGYFFDWTLRILDDIDDDIIRNIPYQYRLEIEYLKGWCKEAFTDACEIPKRDTESPLTYLVKYAIPMIDFQIIAEKIQSELIEILSKE